MRLIGLLGGMSWQSTALYYQLMNRAVERRLGGLHSARILMHSVDFHDIETRQRVGDWSGTTEILADAATGLKAGGADFLVIATNTMHIVADEIAARSGLDVLHIADPTGMALTRAGIGKVGLLGTRFTMEQDFYRRRLETRHDLSVIVPEDDGRARAHDIIYSELCRGIVTEASREVYRGIIGALQAAGAEAIILGCTEITLLVGQADSPVPLFDTTALHAEAAVERALMM